MQAACERLSAYVDAALREAEREIAECLDQEPAAPRSVDIYIYIYRDI